MRPFTSTISIDEARAIIAAGMPRIERRERVPLLLATGRVLASDIIAAADVPPFDRASMDGYAVIAADAADASRDIAKVITNARQKRTFLDWLFANEPRLERFVET